MLLKLIRKDLILHWRAVLPNLLAAAGVLVYAALRDVEDLSPGWLTVIAAVMGGLTPATVAGREERLKTRVLICSLPVDRTTVVAARYLAAWLTFLVFAALPIILFLGIRGPTSLRDLFRPQTIFGMLAAFSIPVGLTLPFVERFGLVGLFVLLIALQVLGLAAVAISFMVPGIDLIGIVMRALRWAAARGKQRLGTTGYYAVCALILAALNALSFAVSALLFRRREL